MSAHAGGSPRRGPTLKVRQSDELFERDQPASTGEPVSASLPFRDYLRTTTAAPLTPTTKALLWATTVAVAALFAGSLWKLNQPKPAPRTAATIHRYSNSA